MSILDRIGLDLGTLVPADAPDAGRAAAEAGARRARVRFALGASGGIDRLLDDAAAVADALAGAGLDLLGVVDGGLTVAPEGPGADAPDALAEAWADELAENAAALAGALRDRVAAWEVLPAPNASDGARPSAARWAAAVDRACRAIARSAPEAARVAGGLWSDDHDDGVDYLRAAARAAGWTSTRPPFDGLGLQLRLFRDGGPSEGTVAATLAERSQRLWRAAAAALGEDALRALWVTGVAWDAVYAGESAQARNAWTALDTFTANPDVEAVFWTGLVDDAGATGLYASTDLSPDHRRPAWRAFKDFALYAAQISPAPQILIDAPDGTASAAGAADGGATAASHAERGEAPSAVAPAGAPAWPIGDEIPEREPGDERAAGEAPGGATRDGEGLDDELLDASARIIDLEPSGVGWAPPPTDHDALQADAFDGEPAPDEAVVEPPADAFDGEPAPDEAVVEPPADAFDGELAPDEAEVEGSTGALDGEPAPDEAEVEGSTGALDGEPAPDEAEVEPPADAFDGEAPPDEAEVEAAGFDRVVEPPAGAAGDADAAREDESWLGRAAGEIAGIEPIIVGADDRPGEEPPRAEVERGGSDAGAASAHAPEAPGAASDEAGPILWAIPPSEAAPDTEPVPAIPLVPGALSAAAERAPDLAPTAAHESPRGTVVVRIPTLADVLRGHGLDGAALEAALRALEVRAPGPGQLPPPGEYALVLAPPSAPATSPGPGALEHGPTNQAVLGALYRAAGGRWTLVERAGLDLARLVVERDAAFDGPDVAALPGLSDAEREAVRAAMR